MAVVKLNTLGEMCPVPVIKAEKKVKTLKPGDTLVVETDHSCAPRFIVEQLKKYPCHIEIKEVAFGIWQVVITLS
ncbi:MAG: sulfurtransferase TusA family protein [Thermoanaerobacteraceae bacterium]|nr:sulfurtransferase TusA family protein [Thermoanaerobacteraceae bacterium]